MNLLEGHVLHLLILSLRWAWLTARVACYLKSPLTLTFDLAAAYHCMQDLCVAASVAVAAAVAAVAAE